jgi:hypothetical protein
MLPAFCSWLHEEQFHIAVHSPEGLCVLKQITSLIAESGLNMDSPKSAGLRCLLRSCLRRRQVIDTATDFALPGIGVSAACACKGSVLLNYMALLSWRNVTCSSVCFWKLYTTFRAAYPQIVAASAVTIVWFQTVIQQSFFTSNPLQ